LVVGPAAFTVHRSPSFSITGPQWYSTAPFKSTGGGFFIRYACTLSRPVNISPVISTTSPTCSARICASVSGGVSTTSRPVNAKPSLFVIFSTMRAGSRYSQRPTPPAAPPTRTPSRRNAQQSYATDTKKLAGSRFAAVILQPINEAFPPNPIAPTPSLLARSEEHTSEL